MVYKDSKIQDQGQAVTQSCAVRIFGGCTAARFIAASRCEAETVMKKSDFMTPLPRNIHL